MGRVWTSIGGSTNLPYGHAHWTGPETQLLGLRLQNVWRRDVHGQSTNESVLSGLSGLRYDETQPWGDAPVFALYGRRSSLHALP